MLHIGNNGISKALTHLLPDAAYMRLWIGSALDQKMVCRLLNQCWVIVSWAFRNRFQWNFNQKTKLIIHDNAFENIVCEMTAILYRGRWVNSFYWKIMWVEIKISIIMRETPSRLHILMFTFAINEMTIDFDATPTLSPKSWFQDFAKYGFLYFWPNT